MKIRPARSLSGVIRLPADKSISHRAAMLAAMATGETRISNYAAGEDCSSTLDCLAALGVRITREGNDVIVRGVGDTGFSPPRQPLDCGNSGTTMRLLSGILAGQSFVSVLTGDESLRRRPMRRIIEPLTQMGAAIEANEGRAPLSITGRRPLRAINYQTPVASAQIKSCVALAGVNADGETVVTEAVATRDHTERMLRWFGVPALSGSNEFGESSVSVPSGFSLTANDISIPADISAAAFFMVAAACLEASDITLEKVGVNPLRTGICDALRDAGVDIEISDMSDISNEPVATIRVRGGLNDASPIVIRGRRVAGLIDEIPVLAVLGTRLTHGIEVRDAAELRVKESDRIATVIENLKRMKADVVEFPDGFRVERCELKGSVVDSYGDHRIAMAFAIAGLLAEGETEIIGAECADVSFPHFYEILGEAVR